jgi:hypothetical protein
MSSDAVGPPLIGLAALPHLTFAELEVLLDAVEKRMGQPAGDMRTLWPLHTAIAEAMTAAALDAERREQDKRPRPDVPDGYARTTTEHEVAGTTSPGQPTDATEQADLQGEPPTSPRPPSPLTRLALCANPDCEVAWAFRDPPTEHYHPRPHGPELPDA